MDWTSLKKIICIRLDAMGDVLMTEPALRAIKESMPKVHLTLLTSPAGQAAARLISCVDEVMVFSAPWMKDHPLEAESSGSVEEMVHRLREREFDAAVIFTVYSQSALPAAMMCWLAKIPLRLAHSRENPYQLLSHWRVEVEPEKTVRHEVRRQLELVASVGFMTCDERIRVQITSSAHERLRSKLNRYLLVEKDRFIVCHPGATAQSRRYSPEKFVEVIETLLMNVSHKIILTGSEYERELIQRIQTRLRLRQGGRGVVASEPDLSRVISMCGELDVDEFAALISRADLLISNNTGAVHLAAGVRTAVVDLYALTNPQHTPWMVPHRVLFHDVSCKYCYKSVCPEKHNNCLSLVEPEQVVQAAYELLSDQPLVLKEHYG